MKKNLLPFLYGGMTLLALPLHLQAQTQAKDTTLTRTVVVEQEYNPDIMDASKVNVLPRIEEPTVSKKAVEYNETLQPASRLPIGTMRPYVIREKQDKTKAGYVRLGYGIYNNLDARANYLFTLSPKDRLNVTFAMDGRNGSEGQGIDNLEQWKPRYYRTQARISYLHNFKALDLNIAGNFGLHNFNLEPYAFAHKQKFTSGNVHVGVVNRNNQQPISYKAETNLLLYQRQNDPIASDIREGIVRTKGIVSGSISDVQSVGIGFNMDNVFYKNADFDNYSSVGLNPYYQYNHNSWGIKIGANIDMAFGFGKKFRAAPDVSMQYKFADSYVLYAQATGGKLTNDFQRMEQYNPYSVLHHQLDATYEQMNAAIGFKASPVNELWFNIYGGYQDLKNDLYALWYNDMIFDYVDRPIDRIERLLYQADTRNVYVGGEVTYNYKQWFSLQASTIYRHWDTDETSENIILRFKPALDAHAEIGFSPLSGLKLAVGYRHIERTETDVQVDPVSDLYIHGSYELCNGLSVYARIHNLLDKNYEYYEGCPAQGLNFLGGVSFRF